MNHEAGPTKNADKKALLFLPGTQKQGFFTHFCRHKTSERARVVGEVPLAHHVSRKHGGSDVTNFPSTNASAIEFGKNGCLTKLGMEKNPVISYRKVCVSFGPAISTNTHIVVLTS